MGIGSSGVVNCANTYLGTANYTVADGYVADRTPIVGGNGPAQLNLNFARDEVLDPRITFSRTSNATRVNAQGLIETVAVNQPRFDYDPVTLAPKGLLIEEQRTNLALNSVLAGAVGGSPGTGPTNWAIGFGTGCSTALVNSIYGTSDQAIQVTGTAGNRLFFSQSINVTSGVQYAFSVYLESISGQSGDFLLVTPGTATVSQNTYATNPNTPGRYTILFTATSTGTVNVRVGFGTSNVVSVNGTLVFSRPQIEEGAFPTSYIPTTSGQVTRTVDNASMTGTNFSSWYNQSEGTVVAEFDSLSTLTAAQSVAINRYPTPWHIEAGTSDTYVLWYGANAELYIGGSYNNIGNVPTASFNKFAAAISSIAGNSASSLNAGNAITRNGIATGTATSLGLGSNPLNSTITCLNGHIQSFKYFNKRLLNSYLQSLTQ